MHFIHNSPTVLDVPMGIILFSSSCPKPQNADSSSLTHVLLSFVLLCFSF